MGGDHGPSVTLLACKQFLQSHPDAQLLLVGLPQALVHFHHPRASVVPATEVVTMEDPLEIALRRKKDSSMRVAIEQVRDGKADAAVSAGNTGALMAISRYVLKTLEGIDRPAIAGQFPQCQGRRHHHAGHGRQCGLQSAAFASVCLDGYGLGVRSPWR